VNVHAVKLTKHVANVKTCSFFPEVDFEAWRTALCRADNLSFVRFDCNDYSVPSEHAYKQITAVGSVDTVRFLVDDAVVAEHPRNWGKKKTYYNPLHYLSLEGCSIS